MKRFILLFPIFILAGALLFVTFRKPPQNLILISIDTLRADHMDLYGYKRTTAPNLSVRARDAVVYERAFVQWPKTVPSMVSMFTSTYAHSNGVLFGSRGQYIVDELVLLPEILKENGFTTYGVVSNAVLAGATNFSQGFDTYVETWMDETRGKQHSQADHVTDLALQALQDLKDKKFFLWLHYVDPHYQYRPPEPYDGMFVGDQFYDKKKVLRKNPEPDNYYGGIAGRIWDLDQKDEWDYYIAQYDAEIRYLDHHLQRLFRAFEKQDLWKNSVIVFTSDHGENLGENRYFFEHGWFPYTASSHVPLMIWDPRIKASRKKESVALLDLAPTVLEKMKIEPPSTFEGRPFGEKNRPVYIESGEGNLNQFNFIRSVWIWPYHLVYVPSPRYQNMMQKSLFELYNVQNDWYETTNIIQEEQQKAQQLKQHLLQWIKSAQNYVPPPSQTPEYDPEAIEQMEALGYVQK